MFRIRQTLAALTVSSILAVPATFATAQAVEISAEQLNTVLAACVDPSSEACTAALQAVVAAYPGVQPSVVVGSVAAQLAAVSNSAIAAGSAINFAAVASSLSALSSYASTSLGLSSLGSTIAAIGSAVGAGESVDVGAIASGDGDGDGAPDDAASPA